jgi:maleate isomerase
LIGYRARLGFLLPPGNRTIEPEMIAMCPQGVSLHFSRSVARGAPGALHGQAERNSRDRRSLPLDAGATNDEDCPKSAI